MTRFYHHRFKSLGVRVVEAKCLRYVGHHPALAEVRSVFGRVPEQLQSASLITVAERNRWRLTRKGASLLRKLNAAHANGRFA